MSKSILQSPYENNTSWSSSNDHDDISNDITDSSLTCKLFVCNECAVHISSACIC